MRRRLGPLGERDFRRLYVARALSIFGDAIVPVTLAFAVFEVDDSAAGIGYVLGSRTVSLVAFLLAGGVLADRLSRKTVLIVSDLVRLVAHGAAAALLVTGAARLWHLVALSFLFGCGWALFLPTSTAFVPETVSPARLQQANALLASTYSAAQIGGPVVAGALVVAVGPGWALAVDAATFMLSALFVARIGPSPRATRPARPSWRDLAEGWRAFRSRTWLWVDGVYSALAAFAVFPAFFALGPLVADRHLGGARAWATVVTGFGVGSVVAGLVLMRARPRRPLLVAVPPVMLLALPLALLALRAPAGYTAAAAVAGGFGLTIFNTLFETTVQQLVPAEVLSRVASIDWMLSQGLQPLGYALVGPVAEAVGPGPPLAAAAVWVVVLTLAVLTVRGVRDLRVDASAGAGPSRS